MGMLSAISMRGEMHWMVYAEPMNSALFTDYLGYLTDDVEDKIFFVVDRVAPQHPGHLFVIASQALRVLWMAPEKIRDSSLIRTSHTSAEPGHKSPHPPET
jgi:hypothetical protein